MRSTVCVFMAGVACCVACLVGWPVGALAREGDPQNGPVSVLGSPTVIPGAESMVGGQRALAEEARRASPEAVAEREASRTAFVGLAREASIGLAEKDFGINHPSWTPPEDEGTGHITKYLGENAAVEDLPNGQHLVVASTVPLQSAVGSGQDAPTSLVLQDRGGSYQPANPVVPVSISKVASEGVSFPLGIKVAPEEAATSESPELAGGSVVYSNTGRDTDFIVEPVPSGVEASWQLRSPNSPQINSLTFTLPEGASLRMSPSVPMDAEVVEEGRTLLLIPPAHAHEADGQFLPVSYSVSGNTLTTHVNLSGSVDFPVLVDPILTAGFGLYGTGSWTGWHSADNCGASCYTWGEHENNLTAFIAPGSWPAGDWGEWYINAPGHDSSIERVDIEGVSHVLEETNMWAEIGYSSGSNPVWTFSGYRGAEGPSPYYSNTDLGNDAMAFCAQGAGGYDGGAQPLCNENYGGEFFRFGNETRGTATGDNATEISGASIKYLDTVAPSQVRLWGLKNTWTKNAEYAIEAKDEGLGIGAFSVDIPPGHLNSEGKPFFAENVSCPSGGIDGCPLEGKSKSINFSVLGTGIYTLGVYAYDEAGNQTEEQVGAEDEEQLNSGVDPKLYLDQTPPKMAALTGSLAEANGGIIGGGNYTLNFSAEDGSTSAPQSGVYKFLVYVDGRLELDDVTSCPDPHGIPSSSCFSFNGSWMLEGQKYGAGPHTITVAAVDWAGNESSESVHVILDEAPYEAAGPGGVRLKTGDYKLVAGDVSVAGPGADLALSRSYDSRALTAGSGGPLGPQWSLSVPDAAVGGTWQSLQALPNGGVELTAVTGAKVTFASNGSGGYTSPAGYQTETLTEPSKSPAEYRLTNAGGDATTFTRVSSSGEEVPLFVPSGSVQAESAGGLNKTTYLFSKTTEGVVEPTAVVAPYTASLKCVEKIEKKEELVNGCRALTFAYATETKAKGEGPAEWGEYKGRLSQVYLKTWSKSAGKITSTPVAQYSYDTLGRLRAEWNPEISPALKTTYGYDPEGHITAVTQPGQETWTLTYGTIAGDSSTGRMIKATQAPAATKLWGGQLPKNTEAPKLSGTAVVGVTMGASSGVWSNEPVSYAYKWEDCNSKGESCTAILGATNANYTVASSDVGHTLVSVVAATNGGGTVSVSTAASTTVTTSGTKIEGTSYSAGPGITVEYHVPLSGTGLPLMTKIEVETWGQKEDQPVEGTAILPPDKPVGWPAKEYTRATIYYQDSDERLVNVSSATGGISTSEYNSHNSVVRTLSADDRATAVKELKPVETAEKLSTKSTYNSEGTELEETVGPEHEVTLSGGSEVQARKKVKYTYNEEGAPTEGRPYRLVTSTEESALVAGKEEEPRTVSQSYSGQENLGWKLHAPTSTTTDPEGLKLVHTTVYSPTTGQAVETKMPAATGGQVSEYPLPSGSHPFGITTGPDKNLWFTDSNTGKVGKITTGGSITEYAADNDEPEGITSGPDGNVWFVEHEIRNVDHITTSGSLTVYTLAHAGTYNVGIVTGPDENMWFTESEDNDIGKINTKDEVLGEYALPSGSKPYGIAVGSDKNLWFTDYGTSKIGKITTSGTITEYSLPSGSEPYGIVSGSDGNLWFTDYGTNKVGKITTAGTITEYALPSGSQPRGIAAGSEGNLWVAEHGTSKLAEITTAGVLSETALPSGSNPQGLTSGPDGNIWFTEEGTNKIGKISQSSPAGNEGAHDSQIVDYTTGTEANVAACQSHPEWAGLTCQIQPAHQPEVSGLPALPVTTYTYNIWDEPEVTKSTSGEVTRTDTAGYDAAGRLTSKETTSTSGSTLPKIKYEYNPETGLLAKQSTGTGTEEKKITSVYNTLGETTAYTDAEGSTTSYEYEKEADARLKKVTDPKGYQTFGYSSTTGEIGELIDSAAGTFTATYDAEGNITSEGYPNGMSATHTYNPAAEATNLKYTKTTHCTEEASEPCVMFKDAVVPNVHGEWATQTSSLSSQSYSYDNSARLTEVQSTPVGKVVWYASTPTTPTVIAQA